MISYLDMATKLTIADVEKTAKLANIPISKTEAEKYRKQLMEIVGYVEQLDEIDTSRIEPTYQTLDGTINIWRDDEIKLSLSQTEALSMAGRSHNGYFLTKGVFDE